MKELSQIPRQAITCLLLCAIYFSVAGERPLFAQPGEIPEALKPWKSWTLWDSDKSRSPTPFDNPQQHLSCWPSALRLEIFPERAEWQIGVQVYDESWVSLPGEPENWPQNVRSQEGALPVLMRDGLPAVRLKVGTHQVSGEFRWAVVPQKIALPKSIGIVSLLREGTEVAQPNWDAAGALWLNRQELAEAQQNSLSAKVYRLLEDGIPLWLRTQVELSVSGKSREEVLGFVLPEGWQLSSIDSPLPVAVDEQGQMRVQVRPGNWKIQIVAFRSSDLSEFRFAPGTEPLVPAELIGFQSNPAIRLAELEGLLAIDVLQTTFPEPWRAVPVYQWTTNATFKVVEKMRGLGAQKPQGLSIVRHFWLDDDGAGITFKDQLRGDLQQSWRLDAAETHQLGVVRIDGQRQLITANPINGRPGVEIRSRNLKLEALGRIDSSQAIPASGWLADVDSLQLNLSLPPGWRVFAVLGADRVDGDWLTAWSLLDLFLVLVFAMAVYRLWGIPAGLVALLAFGLSYHEPGSPRWTWLFLLMPVALLRVVGEGTGKRWLEAWRYLALGLVLLNLVPFIARQVQVILYPQLEQIGIPYSGRSMFPTLNATYESGARVAESLREESLDRSDGIASRDSVRKAQGIEEPLLQTDNLAFDPAIRTQTGPAMPEWAGNEIYCRWDGPVTGDQVVRPIYITRAMHQLLTVMRCILLLLLAALLLRMRPLFEFRPERRRLPRQGTTAALALLALLPSATSYGQFPDQAMLDTLRARLLETSDAFPNAANIASLEVGIQDGKLAMNLEVHADQQVAIPIPGKLPSWSPVSVRLVSVPAAAAPAAAEASAAEPAMIEAVVGRREDGYLWVVVPPGVHSVRVTGNLADVNEWVLAFPLLPKRVSIAAPQWQAVGLRPNGVPENQLFFSRFEKSGEDEAKYDQRLYRPIVRVERLLEIGLVWKIHNKVTRLSAPGKAISLKIPLLEGERVVSAVTEGSPGTMEANFAADQTQFTWDSVMEAKNQLTLTAADTDSFVERWVLVSSPVWNITPTGLAPIYESTSGNLMPVWQVWPGETVVLEVRRPQAVPGESLTVRRVAKNTSLGARQRTTELFLEVESSLGGDFVLEVEPAADITSLTVEHRKQPVRRKDAQLIVPLQPGMQRVELNWEINQALQTSVAVDAVKLPVASANVTTTVKVPENRWVLWVSGPLRGPAVRLWIFLFTALLFALLLGSHRNSPLRMYEWVLLALGLTQLHAAAGLVVVAWLYLLAWRGRSDPQNQSRWGFNLLQVLLVLLTVVVLGIFLVVVGKGLLGSPEMFIVGNGSSSHYLNWLEPQGQPELPQPVIVSISIWFYRLAMLLWALWLASALLRWLQAGWQSFSSGGRWRARKPKMDPPIASLPTHRAPG